MCLQQEWAYKRKASNPPPTQSIESPPGLRSRLAQALASSSQPALRRLGSALAAGTPIDDELGVVDDDGKPEEPEAEPERATVWPRAWRTLQTDGELEALFH